MPRKQPTTLAECNAELELAQKQLRQYQNREVVLSQFTIAALRSSAVAAVNPQSQQPPTEAARKSQTSGTA